VLDVPESRSDAAAGEQLLREYVFIHLSSNADKFALAILMLRKLYALVRSDYCEVVAAADAYGTQASGRCQGDNPDSLMHQEVLLPGHLLQQFFKEQMQEWLTKLSELLVKDAQEAPAFTGFQDSQLVDKCLVKTCFVVDLGKRMTYLLSTGNLSSRSGLGLSQKTGFTVVAEKLNFLRYLSHFRSVHRGAYFQELRTTTARLSPGARRLQRS